MRIIGIDYGDARIGLAVSDPLGITAQGIATIKNKGEEKTLSELKKVIDEYLPEKIVIGLPKNMDGSLGFRADATYAFAESLKTVFDGEIDFWDERLTTVGATRYLNETNTVKGARKNVIDTLSACLILEGYMRKNG
ncbi:MAG: Holliday junction resolvase RuvX [Clostridia bacterium]|nr:Holliday junction resolvase RuvX [Clostridia bacterium]MBQ7751630.1 Holliday junction resolvase RuvX [Clostridia bacterium]